MNRSIIFITMMLAASTICQTSMLPTAEMLGVGNCFADQVKRVAKFLDDNIFLEGVEKPNIFYHTCDVEISPNEDANRYITSLRVGDVECILTFTTGHHNKLSTFHDDQISAQKKIDYCRIKVQDFQRELQDKAPITREEQVVLPPEVITLTTTSEDIKKLKHQAFLEMQEKAKADGAAKREAREAKRAERKAGIGMSEEDYSEALHRLFEIVEEHKANPENKEYTEIFHEAFDEAKPTPEEVETNKVLGDFMGHKVDPVAPTRDNKLDEKKAIVGGINPCNHVNKLHLKSLLINLMNQGVFRGFVVYTENITDCVSQLVNGTDYKAIISFNGKERCPIHVYEHSSGVVTLENNMALAQDEVCVGYLTHATYMKLSGKVEPISAQ